MRNKTSLCFISLLDIYPAMELESRTIAFDKVLGENSIAGLDQKAFRTLILA